MPANEQYANNPQSTLSAGIVAGDTTLTVVSATTFSAVPQFRLVIDSELLLVTGVSGTTFTVSRGMEGTTAASHSSGAVVTQILTRDGLKGVGGSIILSDSDAARPAAAFAGRLYLPNDQPVLYREDSSSWSSFGPIVPLTAPVDSQFSWFNQTSQSVTATVTASNGTIVMSVPVQVGGTEQFRIREIATPATPYTVTACVLIFGYPENFWSGGLILRESGTGKSIAHKVGFATQQNFEISKFNADFSFNTAYQTSHMSDWPIKPSWFQISDDGTNRHFRVSADGVNFIQLFSVGRTDFITPNKIGWFGSAAGATAATGVTLISWKVS